MSHTYGSKVVVTEFKAFYCPPCKSLHERILNQVHDLSSNLPVTFVHKFARIRPDDERTSIKAYCAQLHGGLLRTSIDTLFWMPTINAEQFLSMTMIDPNQFLACINSQQARTYVLRDFSDVGRAEVSGVPSIFVQGRYKGIPRSVDEMMRWIKAEL
jgi:protein-disulfide isomerase